MSKSSIQISSRGRISSKGIIGAKRVVKQLAKENPIKLAEGLQDAAEFLLVEALVRTPYDTGALYKSGRVLRLGSTKKRPQRNVSFGGIGDVDYAVKVHEDPVPFHPVGQYKYLEEPARLYRIHLRYLVVRKFK